MNFFLISTGSTAIESAMVVKICHKGTFIRFRTQANQSWDKIYLLKGGLSWDTTEQDIMDYFREFGDVMTVHMKYDITTGRARGFGFVTFKTAETVEAIIPAGDLTIRGKKVEPKRTWGRQDKVFIGGPSPKISQDNISNPYFKKFRAVDEKTIAVPVTMNLGCSGDSPGEADVLFDPAFPDKMKELEEELLKTKFLGKTHQDGYVSDVSVD